MIYDISMLIHEDMQTYKNTVSNKPVFKNNANHSNSSVHDTSVTLNLHTGTHVDYPLHMIENGDTSDSENLEPLIGSAKVLDLTNVEDSIKVADLMRFDIVKGDFILFKTKNSFSEDFLSYFIYLSKEASVYLLDKGIRGAGTDALGIERSQEGHPTHKTLLGNGIIILEGLRLKDVDEGSYHLICLPLKIKGVEASHVRAVLIK
jgi:arylformamidase